MQYKWVGWEGEAAWRKGFRTQPSFVIRPFLLGIEEFLYQLRSVHY